MIRKQRRKQDRGSARYAATRPILLTERLLRTWPLPEPEREGDKEARGRATVAGGSASMPGAVILAGTGALRAGAGKLRIAACRTVAPAVATAVPEARVYYLAETKTGSIAASAAAAMREACHGSRAVLIGPGLENDAATSRFVSAALAFLGESVVVLDAGALGAIRRDTDLSRAAASVVLTPHAEEMAEIMGASMASVIRDPYATALSAARKFQAVVVLKGAETFIVSPDGDARCNRAGNVGLATSGSGDALSGIITGLAARGAPPFQAASWGVYLHAWAGDALAEKMGGIGFLARELPAEVPGLMARLARKPGR